jgi:hypothetical protein
LKKQIITNPDDLKDLYLETFKFRLRQRPPKPGFEDLLKKQEELFKLRLECAKLKRTAPWKMTDLESALKSLKIGKCRDPEGILREIFKEGILGHNLKQSMLMLYNKIKETGKLPEFMRTTNISAIYKGKCEMSDLDSDRGIFSVSIFRTILMKLIYQDKYDIIEESMSDSNIGARKKKNIRNHIFIVNSVLHDVLSKKSEDPVDIMILDYKQMFDSECLFECMNDLYEAGVTDDIFALVYEANKENFVAVNTPNGLSKREPFMEIVMQGDVLAPLISSLQVDTFGKECMDEEKHLYYYKGSVPIPPLGMVDDLFTISKCGQETTKMNEFINTKTATKRLQFGTSKCVKMHVGKTCNPTLCRDLFVDGWNVEAEENTETGQYFQKETFCGQVQMKQKQEQVYLGDVISVDGKHDKNVEARKNKSQGIIKQIMQILQSVCYGKYYFEVAMVLRSSLLLSSLLLNSEAWVNLSDKNIRSLEQTDEILLAKILDSEANTSNVFKYLELGVYPVRYEIMKRKILFLHYLLQQDKHSMIYKVLESTRQNPLNNDFVKTCNKYLQQLDIHLTFEQLGCLSAWNVKKLVKEKTAAAAFKYLMEIKNKQTKISHIKYDDLEIQEYLVDGNRNTEISKFIFKARSMTLNIKTQKSWKYSDSICVGCGVNEETGDEVISCSGFTDNKEKEENIPIKSYQLFFDGKVTEMSEVAKVMMRKLKVRDKLLDGLL